jgi:uracil-DNA glycosylase family 4
LCQQCPSLKNKFVPPDIVIGAPLMEVGERPGETEVNGGRVFIGDAGRINDGLLAKAGTHRRFVSIANTVACYAKGNTTPTTEEIECCAPVLEQAIADANPRALLALGGTATRRLIGDRPITTWRGSIIARSRLVQLGEGRVLGPDTFKSGPRRGQLKPHKVMKEVVQPEGLPVVLTLHPASLPRTGFVTYPLVVRDFRKAVKVATGSELVEVGSVLALQQSAEVLGNVLSRVKEVVLDVETNGRRGELTIVGVAPDVQRGFTFQPTPEVLSVLRRWLSLPTNRLIGHNIGYDVAVLEDNGIRTTASLWDTMHAAHFDRADLSGGKTATDDSDWRRTKGTQPAKALDMVASRLGGYYYYNWKEQFRSGLERNPHRYCALDCTWTRAIYDELRPKFERERRLEAFEQGIMPAVPVLLRMQEDGVRVDEELRAELYGLMWKGWQEVEDQWTVKVPTVRPGQSVALMDWFYNHEGLEQQYNGRGAEKRRTLDDGALEKLLRKYPKRQELRLLAEWRHLKGIMDKYLSPELFRNGRLYPQYNLSGTFTGRLSGGGEDGFNFQNIPRTGKANECPKGIVACQCHRLRGLFLADAGDWMVGCADWSQLEYRLVAILAGEGWLIDSFKDRAFDIHTFTSSELGVARNPVAKNVNFAMINWAGADKIAATAKVDMETAMGFLQRIRARIPAISQYQAGLLDFVRKNGYVQTPFGWRMHHRVQRDGLYKPTEVVAGPHQSCGGSMMKIALARAAEAGLKLRVTVHDELVVSLRGPEELPKLKEVMERGYEEVGGWGCYAEEGSGRSWAEAKH